MATDDPLVIPGGAEFLPLLRNHHLSLTQGRLILRGDGAPSGVSAELDDVSLTWAPSASGGGTASAHALARRVGHRSGRLDLTADVDASGAIHSAQGVVSGAGFAHVLSKLSDYVTVQPEAWLKADFTYAHVPDEAIRHRVTGELRFEDFGFEAWRISHIPVAGLEGAIRYAATIEPEAKRLSLDITEATMGGARARGGLTLTLRPSGPPLVEARFAMPKQDCGKLAQAVPKALLPRLKDLELAGELWADATFSVDLTDPSTVKLDVDGSTDRCRVVNLGGGIDLDALHGDFVHHPIEPNRGRREDIAVGRGTPQWIPASQLPRYLRAAAIATEDRAFRSHEGVRWDLLAKAIKLNLEKGRFVYGGSTITQQLVKNLFLTREKTLSRKFEELIISWELE
ncbi:MAG: biosynthetic peptidoglycan transglycosylase, partial [Myxococcota bacterium]|nr:biosynthetic peptidoglycan transglycosylase [Myxococcota bacterium]